MKLREILEELRKLRESAWLNKGNTFNNNDKRTKEDIDDFLNTEWNQVLPSGDSK